MLAQKVLLQGKYKECNYCMGKGYSIQQLKPPFMGSGGYIVTQLNIFTSRGWDLGNGYNLQVTASNINPTRIRKCIKCGRIYNENNI